jgi:endonuclease/exonuclease/phosphatase family metal-dependent hydrolase
MDAQQGRIKLLSYNVQVGIPTKKYRHYITHSWKHLLPFSQRQNNLDRIADFISDFDIVGLQELDAGSIRSEFIHQPEYVAKKAGFPYCYSRVNRDLGIVAQNSLAIFSRCEAHRVVKHKLPSTIPGRGALEAHFGSKKDPLVVILAHLSLSARGRKRQLEYIASLVNGYKHVVVMGDLNTEIESREIKGLLDSTTLSAPQVSAHTYPSWNPKIAYDHILVTPDIHLGDSEVYGVKHSDHLPISIEVDVPHEIFAHQACKNPTTNNSATILN